MTSPSQLVLIQFHGRDRPRADRQLDHAAVELDAEAAQREERRVAGPGETTASLGTAAAAQAIKRARLTPADIELLLRTCQNIRDKALIAILWETGGRISEIGNLQLKHIVKIQHGFTLDVLGKTGRRSGSKRRGTLL